VERLESAMETAAGAAKKTGAATEAAAAAAEPALEEAAAGWQAVTQAVSEYSETAREIGDDLGQNLVGAFQSAESAVGEFVKTGKLGLRDLAISAIADLAQIGARRFLLSPLSNALGGFLGQSSGGVLANVLHTGGIVGDVGLTRQVPALAFAGASRMHAGGAVGLGHTSGFAGLRPDEIPAILQRGERVLSRREAQGYGRSAPRERSDPPLSVNVTIMARDAESFRQSRTQVASDIARAVSLGRRGL
jgi:Lambda phage tail tape-measure protein (Tape_meas_lam_C)